jgi:hypothetical protein
MDSYNAQFFVPLLIGLAGGLMIGFVIGAAMSKRWTEHAHEIVNPPIDLNKKQKY